MFISVIRISKRRIRKTIVWKLWNKFCISYIFSLIKWVFIYTCIFNEDLYIDGSVQDSNNAIANTLELLQSFAKPLMLILLPLVPHTVETLYSTIYYSNYFIELNFDKSTQYAALWTHKRHPISRPFGRAMECLLWVLQQKLTLL